VDLYVCLLGKSGKCFGTKALACSFGGPFNNGPRNWNWGRSSSSEGCDCRGYCERSGGTGGLR